MEQASEKDFANARFVRNIFETMIINQARRLFKVKSPSLQDLKELSENDIPTGLHISEDNHPEISGIITH